MIAVVGRSFRVVCVVALGVSLVTVGVVFAQPAAVPWDKDIDELAMLVRAMPPEIAADGLIKLVTGPLDAIRTNAAAQKRVALLEEAWALAESAQEPIARRPVPGAGAVSSVWFSSTGLQFDRLSLRSRVVSALVRDRPADARIKFLSLNADVPALTCRDSFVSAPQGYFSAAQAIASSGFTRAERARGDHVSFLESAVSRMRSAAHVEPTLNLLFLPERPADELARLVDVFTTMLRGIDGDDLTFSYGSSPDALSAMFSTRVVTQLKQAGIRPDGLLDAYRGYLSRHMGARRCGSRGTSLPGSRAVNEFNTKLRFESVSELPPIDGTEVKAAGVEPPTSPRKPSALALRVLNLRSEISALRKERNVRVVTSTTAGQTPKTSYVTVNGREYPSLEDVPVDMELFQRLTALNQRLGALRAEPDDDPEEFFQVKSQMYWALFSANPVGQLSEDILSGFIQLASQYDLDRHSRSGWYAAVSAFLTMRPDVGPETIERIRQRFSASGHPTLKAMVALTNATSKPR